ncbi:DNA (cytosine-5)-methyltransferase 1B-like isoform X2 [Aristolochia californica]|uniref:DNA (cytosine-5)-methyltransferase 1B-like isoform X2 n=1 Tax=Aristolochia californica TaxID=171875 RepID=UPI0035DFC7BD
MGSAAALELNPETVKPPKGRVASGMNSEVRGCRRSLRSKSDLNDGVKMDVEGVALTDMKKKKRIASETTESSAGSRKMPKRVAACLDFKEKSIRLNEKSSIYETKDGLVAEEELEAIRLTEGIHGKDEIRPNRRLVDFILHDFDGVPKPFEMSEVEDLYITAVILPLELSEKEKEKGVRCEGFGRIEEWSISGYEDGSPIIWVSTDLADYDCVKPGSSYRESFGYFYDKAKICVEVFQKLSPTCGGNPNSSLEELLATVVRSMSATKTFHGVPSKDFIVSLGEFIYTQLVGLDDTSTAKDQIFAKLPVLVSLLDECKKRNDLSQLEAVVLHGTLQIRDGDDPGKSVSSSDIVDETEDEKLARLLQDEEFRKSMKKQNRKNISGSHKKFYIKINEDEIANDYPLPAYYKSSAEEIDEYIFFDDDSHCLYPDELPRRMLHNWSLYNSESRLISLELLPVCPGAQVDVTIFGSGNMTEDNGSGFCIEGDSVQSSSSGGLEEIDSDGIPIYLSAVKEWMIEFGSSTVFVSIRTDTAWYRLGRPSKQYSPWYEPVLKTAKLAIGIIKLLKEQSRASKLSFPDVIKKVSEFERDDLAYISSNPSAVERYVVVHGQIILRQFSVYPDDAIRKCAFVSVLSDKMEERHHTKLVMNKKMLVKKEINLNPRATLAPVQSKRKAMRATTTKLINRIWRDYYSSHFQEEPKVGDGLELKEEEEIEEEENEEEENGELDNVLIQGSSSPKPPNLNSKTCKLNSSTKEIRWEGESIGKMSTCEALYRSAVVRGIIISLGSTVLVETDSDSEGDTIIYVEYLFEKLDQRKMAHGRVLQRGCSTVLGNASNDSEVFLINECLEIELSEVKQEVTVEMRSISWGHQHRKENINTYNITKAKEEERKKRDLTIEYYCKSLYWPERGAFFDLPLEKMGLGSGICDSCKLSDAQKNEFGVNSSKARFVYRKVEYSVQDFVYVVPSHFYEETEEVARYKAGRNIGLKAYVVCQLLEIEVKPQGSKPANHESTKVKVRRFFRPEDISAEKAYMSDIREVYYSEEILKISVEVLEGKCDVRRKHEVPSLDDATAFDHIFFCEYSYDFSNGSLKQLPANMKLRNLVGKVTHGVSSRKSKGKFKVGEDDWDNVNQVESGLCLATLDIFAGCGGLSEGLQNSGVSVTKWAIEYDEPAADAFKLNHPDALVFNDNCNVILRAIMEKCGDKDDCISTSEAAEQAARLSQEKINNLPAPGEVDFINGGPPCQGFSGMNRFSQSTWSKVQCEMILAFLSFAEYFRPKFFLLENVRNFVSFNKGQTFRLTLASLLEMGYQVRFGILEAGAFGVSQSRKRAFIWAAAPGQILPEWPEPMHVFGSPELKIALPGGVHYTAVRSTAGGAPFRAITVRDTIGDLPKVKNGASHPDIQYTMDPVSWFQKQIRGSMMTLCDHISKEMNELNYIRCQRIPKRPGADWRDLPDEKVKLSTGQIVDLIPWCLPNTAKRHNQWKGLFGRLDWEGNFPTSITDPQPMGKVGMCFHPEQDRILTVRECARSQGFPDSYYFSGNIQNKHRQIGNAVPPPLAFALGRKLKKAVEAKAANSLN